MKHNVNDRRREDSKQEVLYDRAEIEVWEFLHAVRVINSQLLPIAHTRQAKQAIAWVISVLVDCAIELSEAGTVMPTEDFNKTYQPRLDIDDVGT